VHQAQLHLSVNVCAGAPGGPHKKALQGQNRERAAPAGGGRQCPNRHRVEPGQERVRGTYWHRKGRPDHMRR
jgi:hypothetical protein